MQPPPSLALLALSFPPPPAGQPSYILCGYQAAPTHPHTTKKTSAGSGLSPKRRLALPHKLLLVVFRTGLESQPTARCCCWSLSRRCSSKPAQSISKTQIALHRDRILHLAYIPATPQETSRRQHVRHRAGMEAESPSASVVRRLFIYYLYPVFCCRFISPCCLFVLLYCCWRPHIISLSLTTATAT